jgi:hypothetical protein
MEAKTVMTAKHLTAAALATLSLALSTGCATTRVVKTQPGQGGEIMVQEGLFGDARTDAKKKMASNCGRKKAAITEEGEAVVGTRSHKDTQLTNWGSSSSGETDNKTEWRIKYRCR